MNIRRGKLSDTEQILEILNSSPELQANQNEKFYTKNFVKGAINSKDRSIVLIAEDKSRIVGFLIAEIDKDKQYGFINDIFVKKFIEIKELLLI